MAEKKNTQFDRPGGYAQPKGATQIQRKAARDVPQADIRLFGDSVPPFAQSSPSSSRGKAAESSAAVSNNRSAATPRGRPLFNDINPSTDLYVGDCRDVLANLPEK